MSLQNDPFCTKQSFKNRIFDLYISEMSKLTVD